MRRIRVFALAVVAVLSIGAVAAAVSIPPPDNDDIANATEATSLPFVATGSNEGATTEKGEYAGCNSPGVETVWFSYTAAETGTLVYEAAGTGFEPRVWVFKGPAGAAVDQLTPLGNCGWEPEGMNTVAGTTYFFQVAAYSWEGAQTGEFTFRLNAVGNQDFANAQSLSGLPAYARGANIPYLGGIADSQERIEPVFVDGLEEGEPQPCGRIGFTVWYRMTSTVDAALTANTFDVSGDLGTELDARAGTTRTDFDTVLAVYAGPADATFDDLILLGCNDDSGQGVSRVDFAGKTGETYYFQVGGYDAGYGYGYRDAIATGSYGVFDLTVSALCRDLPATIVGTNGDDVLTGTGTRDVIAGLGGDDVINGLGGRDVLCGGPGDDVIRGGGGGDKVLGQNGDDVLFGNRGNDSLWGGHGVDEVNGGPHRDRCLAETSIACEV